MNAKQRRDARRNDTPSPQGMTLLQAYLALMAEHTLLRTRLATFFAEQEHSNADLRVSVQYLMLDLEATKRENAALRQQLEER